MIERFMILTGCEIGPVSISAKDIFFLRKINNSGPD